MAEIVEDPWRWFHQHLALDERVAVMQSPHGRLPASVTERLVLGGDHSRVVGYQWLTASVASARWELSPETASLLDQVLAQLEHWWTNLTDEHRTFITEHRHGEFPASYGEIVDAASASPFDWAKRHIVISARNGPGGEFRLMPLVEAFVEMKARG